MSRKDYLPSSDPDKLVWLSNFAQKAAFYKTVLGLSNDTVEQLETDLEAFAGTLAILEGLRNTLEAVTAFKNQLRNGTGTLIVPAIPVLPSIPSKIQSNIFGRARTLVQTIKLNPNYTESIGDDMRIIGEETPIDPATLQPQISLKLAAGGHPEVVWHKGQTSGVKIKVDRGAGFEFLATDTQPNYTDTHPLPPFGQSAVWKYTAIYLLGDEEAGQWSNIVNITVAGQP